MEIWRATAGATMLANLRCIYHLRVNRLGTEVLLARVFFNVCVAGQLNELETDTDTGIQTFVQEARVNLGSLAVDSVAAKVAGKLGSRGASGVLNYYLLKRLGGYAARLLRPVLA